MVVGGWNRYPNLPGDPQGEAQMVPAALAKVRPSYRRVPEPAQGAGPVLDALSAQPQHSQPVFYQEVIHPCVIHTRLVSIVMRQA